MYSMIPIFILIACVIFLLLGVGFTAYFGYFDTDWFMMSLIILVGYGLGFAVIQRFMREAIVTEKDGDIHVDFRKMNMHLKMLSGGRAFQWEEGLSRRSLVKEYKNLDNKPELFRSFMGKVESTGQDILIIYNITRQMVWRYWSPPSKGLVSDPFHKDEFQPFEKQAVIMDSRFLKNKKRRRGGMYLDDGGFGPSDDAAEQISDELDN